MTTTTLPATWLLLWSASACLGATFFVGPGGSDTNPGTEAAPLGTFAAARDAARAAGDGPHQLVAQPGDYYLTTPLSLSPLDNGLTIEAKEPGTVNLYGGKLVTGWQRDGEKFWAANLPGAKEGTWDFRALLVNGRLAERACFPGKGEFEHLGKWDQPLLPAMLGFWARKPTHEELTTMPYDPKDIPASLDVRNAEVRMYHMWSESLVGVERNDLAHHALIFATEPANPPGALNRRKYVIYNTIEGMTKPGQWYLDRTNGRLVYWPLPEENLAESKVVAPTVESVVRLAGTRERPAEGITLRGLSLQATTAPLRQASFGAGGFDGAVTLVNAKSCALERLDVCQVGGLGVRGDAVTDCRISDCQIGRIGACGVRLNGSGLTISGNHIHDVGVYYPGAAALMLYGNDSKVQRNELHDAPYSGVIAGGTGQVIEQNLIYRVMRVMHDGAAVYGNLNGAIIRDNIVRDVVEVGSGFGASAYYLDEGSRDCLIEHNVAVGVPMPTHNHITCNTTVRNNVFIADGDMTVSFQRSVGATFEDNLLFVPGQLKVRMPNAIKVWQGNVVYHGGADKAGAPQPFTIDDAQPALPQVGPKDYPIEAERTAAAPTVDGDLAADEWPAKVRTLDRDPSRQPAAGAPCSVRLSYDDECLYLGCTVTMFAPAKLSLGSSWGQDDGLEFSLRGHGPEGRDCAFVLRGYADGSQESSTAAGAPAAAAEALGQAARFAVKELKRGGLGRGWQAEWAIPWAALGLKPEAGLTVPFNLAVYKSEFGEQHWWEGTGAESWRLEEGGRLKLK